MLLSLISVFLVSRFLHSIEEQKQKRPFSEVFLWSDGCIIFNYMNLEDPVRRRSNLRWVLGRQEETSWMTIKKQVYGVYRNSGNSVGPVMVAVLFL
jgi:hypothetical protein